MKKVSVIMRHAERPLLPAATDAFELPLTEKGEKDAIRHGSVLGEDIAAITTSPLLRCVQTAEAIKRGAKIQRAIHTDLRFGIPGAFFLFPAKVAETMTRLGPHETFRQLVLEDRMDGFNPFNCTCEELLRHVLSTSDRPGYHLYVTHDFVVLLLVCHIFGIVPTPTDWPGFLEFLVLSNDDEAVEAVYRDKKTVLRKL